MIHQIFNISFEYHFIGNIIYIRVPFVKDYGIALTEIREKSSFSSHLLFRREGQRKTSFMFIGCMILLNSQIIKNLSCFAFLRQSGKPQGSGSGASLIIHISGFGGIKFFCYKVIYCIEIFFLQRRECFQFRLEIVNGRTQVGFPKMPFQTSLVQGEGIDAF